MISSVSQSLMHFHVTDTSLRWSTLFRKVDDINQKFFFEDVFVSDTTLEQIFLSFAKMQKNADEDDPVEDSVDEPAPMDASSTEDIISYRCWVSEFGSSISVDESPPTLRKLVLLFEIRRNDQFFVANVSYLLYPTHSETSRKVSRWAESLSWFTFVSRSSWGGCALWVNFMKTTVLRKRLWLNKVFWLRMNVYSVKSDRFE